MAEISMELFNRRFEQLNEMHRELRQDIRLLADSLLQLRRQVSHLDQRVTQLQEKLGGTAKLDIRGALANFVTRIEHLIERRFAELVPPNQFSED